MIPDVCAHWISPPGDPTSTWALKAELLPHDTSKSDLLLSFYPQIHFRAIFGSFPFLKPLTLKTAKSFWNVIQIRLLLSPLWCFPGSHRLFSSGLIQQRAHLFLLSSHFLFQIIPHTPCLNQRSDNAIFLFLNSLYSRSGPVNVFSIFQDQSQLLQFPYKSYLDFSRQI